MLNLLLSPCVQTVFIVLFILLLFSAGAQAQYADKSQYLIDSLILEDLTADDRILLDSSMTLYHQAVQDTDKLDALGIVCEGMVHDSWKKYQLVYYNILTDLIEAEDKNGRKDSVVYSDYQFLMAGAANNMAIILKQQGDIPKALEFFHQSLKIYEDVKHMGGV